MADDAINRVALAGFRNAVADAIACGAISTSVWDHFVEGALATSFGHRSSRRYNLRHARWRLAPIVERSLAA